MAKARTTKPRTKPAAKSTSTGNDILFRKPIEWGGDRGLVTARLAYLGWLGKPEERQAVAGKEVDELEAEELRRILMAYQAFHGLHTRDGSLDAETIRSLTQLRYCGHPDVEPLTASLGRWAFKDIGYFLNFNDWPRIGMAKAVEAIAEGWKMWSDVADINIFRVTDRSKAAIVISLGRGDGPFNVLAFAQVPGDGNSRQLTAEFDRSEAWGAGHPMPQNQIDLIRVLAHEGAHNLGIMHIRPGNLLAPTYDQNIRSPQAGDIAEITARYGPRRRPVPVPAPVPTPTPSPTDPPPPSGSATIQVTGNILGISIPGWTVTRNP